VVETRPTVPQTPQGHHLARAGDGAGDTLASERELQADQIKPIDAPELPLFDCPGCGTTLCFADLPQRFFQFLAFQ